MLVTAVNDTAEKVRHLLNTIFPTEITLPILELAGFWARETVSRHEAVAYNVHARIPFSVYVKIANAARLRAFEIRTCWRKAAYEPGDTLSGDDVDSDSDSEYEREASILVQFLAHGQFFPRSQTPILFRGRIVCRVWYCSSSRC